MRSHRLVAVAGILAVSLSALVGCSSDNSTTSYTPGDPNDPAFLAIQEGVNTFIDSTIQYSGNGFATQGMLISGGGTIDPPSFTPINSDSDVVVTTYNANTGWHEIYVTRTALAYGANWRDSVQFRNADGQYQQNPSNCAEFSYRHYLTIATHDTTVSSFRFGSHASFEFTGINTNIGTINGSHDWSAWAKHVSVDSTTWHWLNFSSEVSDLTFEKNGSVYSEHPSGGSVNATLEHVYQKNDVAPDTTSWYISVNFGSTSRVSVIHDNTSWSYTYGE